MTPPEAADAPGTLALTSAAVLTPWGEAADGLPGAAPVKLPKVKGFLGSRFSPLVHAVAQACLGEAQTFAGPDGKAGHRTGIVVATLFADTTTTDTSTRRVMEGQVHNPLLFFQSVTTSVLGHLGKVYGIRGPFNCVSGVADLAAEALGLARVVLDSGDVDQLLVVGVECAPNERAAWVHGSLSEKAPLDRLPAGDTAVALLLRRAAAEDGLPRAGLAADTIRPEWTEAFGWLTPLVATAEAAYPSTAS
ncbi:ketosynthase [Streptomyces exfoliatus]|uniref:ketosynthase n=1 Tax=Streptomyces exfoliatus TaxID=1905 RepID=UPI003C2E25C6